MRLTFLSSAFFLALQFFALGANEPAMLDFTKGDTVAKDGPHDWALGPTGARGWIFTATGHSREARQILVTAVATDSPAAARTPGHCCPSWRKLAPTLSP